MKIVYSKDYDTMARKAANLVGAQILMKPNCVLGLATGSSPIGLYKELIRRYEAGELDFSACHSVNLDEYVGLAKQDPHSYAYFMNDNLFSHINIPKENTNIPDGTNLDAEDECARYEKVMADLGGIDLQVLGIGHNGHVGFNEPEDCFQKATHCVDLKESTIAANTRFFDKKEDVPRKAYTMGIMSIMNARKIVLLASGESKADIIYRMATGPITPQIPASVLQLHQDVTVFCDEPALSVMLEKAPELVNGRPQ